jgi:hypothetical protein
MKAALTAKERAELASIGRRWAMGRKLTTAQMLRHIELVRKSDAQRRKERPC